MYPKQFVKLFDEESLFQSLARRMSGPCFAAPTIVTGNDFRFVVVEQMASVGIAPLDILVEPSARNTAAAICAAALPLNAKNGDNIMLVAPSDHLIPDFERFQVSVRHAVLTALDGQIVTFGIRPNRSETGYGWLELDQKPSDELISVPQSLLSFVGKPNVKAAESLLNGGLHLWNSGIFLFTTSTILKAFEKHAKKILIEACKAFEAAEFDLGFTRIASEPWSKIDDISIDYAVMEHASNLSVMLYGGCWTDLGDWHSIWQEGQAGSFGVVEYGRSTAIDCKNSLLYSTSDKQELVAIGIEDIIAVAMSDAVLVAHKDRTQEVKTAVARLKGNGVDQAETLPRDYCPWGWFESIATGPQFQVKKITVNPCAALSLQSHRHRSEHWVVVEGTARVTIDDELRTISENQSVYIPVGAVHRMENPEEKPLVIIEVQTGSYFGEDDIERYEDRYARI